MNWRFWRKREPEQRSTAAQGYTAALTAALQAGAEGGVADTAPLATAALEAAAGLYGRCLASAQVTGADDVADALTPSVLALIARNLIRRGEDHHRVYIRAGRLVLEPVGFAYAHGDGPDPMRWTYNATLYGPTDSRHEWVPAASMVHCRYSVDASRPWLGVPPWSWAAATSQAIAALDRMVANEASAPHGALLGMPESPQIDEDGEITPLDAFRSDLGKAKGRTLITEYSGNADPDAPTGQRGSRLEHLRFGMMRETVDALRTATGRDVLAACGVPPSLLVPNSDGTAQRESYRRFLHTALRPMARIVEAELRMKLDAPRLRLDLSELHAADSEARSRSFANLVKAGVHPEDAAAAASLELRHPVARAGDAPGAQ